MMKLSLALSILVVMDALAMDAPLSMWVGEVTKGEMSWPWF